MNVTELRPIGQTSLVQEVYDVLLQQIVQGQLRPGERLDVTALARVLGVSTMPVKQAIVRLEMEGFVEVSPRRGTFVAQLVAEDLLEALDLRLAIDLFVVERVIEVISEDDIGEMRAVHDRMRTLTPGPGNYYLRQSLDRQFHLRPIAAYGNRRMLQIGEVQHTHAQLARVQGTEVRWERADRDHEAILVAFETRNAVALREAIVTHAAHARETLLKLAVRTENARAAN